MIALGAVIKGETDHYAAVCDGVTYGIQKVSIENHIPIMFGVLMCKTEKQALARINKGYECVNGLITMLNVKWKM
jgi:6,7-dimethyl-8-ribityllumazine synthase